MYLFTLVFLNVLNYYQVQIFLQEGASLLIYTKKHITSSPQTLCPIPVIATSHPSHSHKSKGLFCLCLNSESMESRDVQFLCTPFIQHIYKIDPWFACRRNFLIINHCYGTEVGQSRSQVRPTGSFCKLGFTGKHPCSFVYTLFVAVFTVPQPDCSYDCS